MQGRKNSFQHHRSFMLPIPSPTLKPCTTTHPAWRTVNLRRRCGACYCIIHNSYHPSRPSRRSLLRVPRSLSNCARDVVRLICDSSCKKVRSSQMGSQKKKSLSVPTAKVTLSCQKFVRSVWLHCSKLSDGDHGTLLYNEVYAPLQCLFLSSPACLRLLLPRVNV